MLRPMAVLAVLLAALFAWDRALDSRDGAVHPADPGVEPLIARETLAKRPVAALTIENVKSGQSIFYARKHGQWRCVEAFGAIADESALQAFLASLLEARGVLRSADPARAPGYGFDDALRVRLHGSRVIDQADRDVIVAVEIGASTDRSAFARVAASPRILEIDRDPRLHLVVPPGTGLPPLIDTRLLAGSMPEGFRGFGRFAFEFADGRRFAVESQPSAEPDAPPDWFVVHGARRDPCQSWRVGGYTGLWLREHFEGVANPARAAELGLDPPFLTIALTPHGGEAIRFDVSAPSTAGQAYLWNRSTNTLAVISRALHENIVPDPEMFLDETRPNPWERWLSK